MTSRTESESKIALRVIVGILAVALLLAPSFVIAVVWTPLNLLIALSAILLACALSRFSQLRWLIAAAGALLIAVPPYPYWVFWGEKQGWYLHFFHGFTLQNTPIGTFLVFFVLALALFAALFWALLGPRLMPNNSFKPKPLRGSA